MNDDLIPCEKCPTVAICKIEIKTIHYPHFLEEAFKKTRGRYTKTLVDLDETDIHTIEYNSVRSIIKNCDILYNKIFKINEDYCITYRMHERYVRLPYIKLLYDHLMEITDE